MKFHEVLNAAKNLSADERAKLVRDIWPKFDSEFDIKTAISISFRKRERSTIRDHESIWVELKNVSSIHVKLSSITVDTGDENTSRQFPANDSLPPGIGCGHGIRVPDGHNDVLRIVVHGHTMIDEGIPDDVIVGYEPSLF